VKGPARLESTLHATANLGIFLLFRVRHGVIRDERADPIAPE
jgi:hypothetical protein